MSLLNVLLNIKSIYTICPIHVSCGLSCTRFLKYLYLCKGSVKQVSRESGERIPIRRLFVEIGDITSVSCKAYENDVILTLKNGSEYLLDEVEDPTEVYATFCRMLVQDEYD